MSPESIQAGVVQILSCFIGFFVYLILTLVPLLLAGGVFSVFMTRNRNYYYHQREEEFYLDDVAGALIVSVVAGMVVGISYRVMEYWGVPVSRLLERLHSAEGLFPEVEIVSCRGTGVLEENLTFLLSFIAFLSKFLLWMGPVFFLFYLVAQRIGAGYEEVKRNETSYSFLAVKVALFSFFATAGVLAVLDGVLKLVGIDYDLYVLGWVDRATEEVLSFLRR